MMPNTPSQPEIERRLKDRLLDLSPRAFELFAGDLLVYVGLERVAVTRFSGDGGIDAHGDLVAASGLVRVSTAVQVKRYRRNVRRPDIDQLIGAYGGQYDRGIFITTAGYAGQARQKAATSPLLRVDTIDGDQVAALMVQHTLGLRTSNGDVSIDEPYFGDFEAQSLANPARLREESVAYEIEVGNVGTVVRPEDDLISLQALSYALRVDRNTARNWIERGRITPDRTVAQGGRDAFFFRRDQVEELRRQVGREPLPQTGAAWRQAFLDFARSRNLSKSYKPVLLQALFALVDRNGEVQLTDLVQAFQAFYVQRQRAGIPAEFGGLMAVPDRATPQQIAQLIIRFPLDRFLIQHFLEYDAQAGIVRFAPSLWQELRISDLRDAQASVEEQLRYYYQRGA